MSATRFDLVTHWALDAPVERVWDALAAPEGWPAWWPFVRSVQTLRPGAADGLGAVRRLRWATRLPYEVLVEVEAIEVLRPHRLRARARGQLQGEGLWLLGPEGCGTTATYVWRVEPAGGWMRRAAPLLAPVFRWNHDAVMRAGERGLRRHLARTP